MNLKTNELCGERREAGWHRDETHCGFEPP